MTSKIQLWVGYIKKKKRCKQRFENQQQKQEPSPSPQCLLPAGLWDCILGSFETDERVTFIQRDSSAKCSEATSQTKAYFCRQQMCPNKAPPATRNAKVIHLNEFKIHIVLGQIIQCQVQTVCIYVCWQRRPLLGRHSFALVSCAQLGSHHWLLKSMYPLVFGSRKAEER